MRKLLFTVLAASAGCSTAAQPTEIAPGASPTSGTSIAATTGATPVAQGVDHDRTKPLPKRRWVTPGGGGASGGGVGDAGDGGGAAGASSTWQPLVNQPAFYAGTALLLTDGTVMVQDAGAADWWKLTPDASGSYRNGTWTQLASLPDGYAPLYFASAVLPDGRVIVEGGEYNEFNDAWTNLGAIYDPTQDQWTPVAPPAGWPTIGDAQSAVLADGRFYLADCCSRNAALLDPKTLTWTAFGSGKADIDDEESWTLLPNGYLLTVDTNNTAALSATELFSPRSGAWTSAGDTPQELPDTNADGSGSHEMGPVLLRPDGTAFAVGATGRTAVYDTRSQRWTAGPDFPVVEVPDSDAGPTPLDTADGPSVLLPDGHVLVVASPGVYEAPAYVFEFDGRALTAMPAPPGAVYDSSFNTFFLPLPSGEVLFTDMSNDVEIYAPPGRADRPSQPVIDDGCELRELHPGGTYRLSGLQLNGLSQAAAYGDDAQMATNYPLVRITNGASGHVTYARTHDHSFMGVTRGAWSHTSFDVPAGAETGPSELVVVANGVASDPRWVEVRPAGDRDGDGDDLGRSR